MEKENTPEEVSELVREGLFGGSSNNNSWDTPDFSESGPVEKAKVKISNLIGSQPVSDITVPAAMEAKSYTESSDLVLFYLAKLGCYAPGKGQKVTNLSNKISPLRFFNYVKNNQAAVLDMHILNGLSFNETFEGRCVVKMAEGAYYVHLVNEEGYRHTRNVFIGDWSDMRILAFYTKFIEDLVKYDNVELLKPVSESAMDGIILPEDVMSGMCEDVKSFIESKDIYEKDLRIPWKRGYMFIGEPGNGKTSLIRGLIKYWGLEYRDISKMLRRGGEVDFSDMGPSANKSYIDQKAYPTRSKPSVCVIEDIDKFVVGQSSGSSREGDSGAVPLHMLLKALDGIDAIGGVILMATTNYPDQMTEALLARPGRFDRVFKIRPPEKDMIEKFLVSRKLSVIDAPLGHIVDKLDNLSMAFVEELVKSAKMKYKRNEFKYKELSDIIDRIHEHKQVSDKYLGKKKGGGIGFGE